jgi:hypothetical protein
MNEERRPDVVRHLRAVAGDLAVWIEDDHELRDVEADA